MKKIAVFGKPGSGKSTLSHALSAATGVPLYSLDSIQYDSDGHEVPVEVFEQAHLDILDKDSWIIDGVTPLRHFNARLDAADTLIYIDLPYPVSYWLVTKRFLKGLLVKPKGWPEGCSILKGTWQSYQILRLCPSFWNDAFLEKLQAKASAGKTLHVIRSVRDLDNFVSDLF